MDEGWEQGLTKVIARGISKAEKEADRQPKGSKEDVVQVQRPSPHGIVAASRALSAKLEGPSAGRIPKLGPGDSLLSRARGRPDDLLEGGHVCFPQSENAKGALVELPIMEERHTCLEGLFDRT